MPNIHIVILQGRVQFPTGGKVRDAHFMSLIWCNSSTDS